MPELGLPWSQIVGDMRSLETGHMRCTLKNDYADALDFANALHSLRKKYRFGIELQQILDRIHKIWTEFWTKKLRFGQKKIKILDKISKNTSRFRIELQHILDRIHKIWTEFWTKKIKIWTKKNQDFGEARRACFLHPSDILHARISCFVAS